MVSGFRICRSGVSGGGGGDYGGLPSDGTCGAGRDGALCNARGHLGPDEFERVMREQVDERRDRQRGREGGRRGGRREGKGGGREGETGTGGDRVKRASEREREREGGREGGRKTERPKRAWRLRAGAGSWRLPRPRRRREEAAARERTGSSFSSFHLLEEEDEQDEEEEEEEEDVVMTLKTRSFVISVSPGFSAAARRQPGLAGALVSAPQRPCQPWRQRWRLEAGVISLGDSCTSFLGGGGGGGLREDPALHAKY